MDLDLDARQRLWRAYRIAPAVAPLGFCVLLWCVGVVWCGWLGMSCNPPAFVLVPALAIAVGLPAAYLVALALMPLALRLRRRERLTRGIVLLLAAAAAVLFGALLGWSLVVGTRPIPTHPFSTWARFTATSLVAVGPPILLSGLLFHRIAVPPRATPMLGLPPGRSPAGFVRRYRTLATALAVCAALVVVRAWVAVYEPGRPGARIYFQTRPGESFIWESAPGEPKDLLARLEEEGFPIAHSEAQSHWSGDPGARTGRGSVRLVRWRDRPRTRDRVVAWLKAQPEVAKVWIDSTAAADLQGREP